MTLEVIVINSLEVIPHMNSSCCALRNLLSAKLRHRISE